MHIYADKFFRCAKGIGFVFLIFFSTYFGTIFLLAPLLPLFYMVPKHARYCTDKIIWFWKLYCVALYEVLFQTKVKFYGNVPSHEAATLMIMNHRTRFDWLYLFSYQVRYGSVRRYTISLKNNLKFYFGIGWAMQLAGYIFLDRKWEQDQNAISKCLKVFKELDEKPQILLFPEGTDLTKNTKRRSDMFAEKNNLQKYNFVLHPRTTGFTYFVQEMKKDEILDYLLDITIAYPSNIPQNEIDLIFGNFPSCIHFLVKKYTTDDIPVNKSDLEIWCKEKWSEKEGILKDFYEKKSFAKETLELSTNESLVDSMFLNAWVSWTSLQIGLAYLLWCYPILWLYVLACTILFTVLSKYTLGMNLLIASALQI